jgi:large subunit ribosomal protein L21
MVLPMYAVIQTGGKQYKVKEGESLLVERLFAEPETEIVFDRVLCISDEAQGIKIGEPYLTDIVVKARVEGEVKGEKVRIFKMRRRKHYRKTLGHRQKYTKITITTIG